MASSATADPPDTVVPPPARVAFAERVGAILAFIRLSGGYWVAPGAWTARALLGTLVLLTILQVALLSATNYWNAALFDSLEQ
ncbi:MAG: hypothetical protein FJX47_14930, partial [Alphaproteobacteria bacterium]|nr:hypothetical protein [Alphaproteobacteria bacterium]